MARAAVRESYKQSCQKTGVRTKRGIRCQAAIPRSPIEAYMTTKYIPNRNPGTGGEKRLAVNPSSSTLRPNTMKGKKMWPSLQAANHIADWANGVFIVSLAVGVIAAWLIWWTAGVKEKYWEESRGESSERIAVLSRQAQELRRDTADANARALEAQATLAKLQAPRSLTARQQEALIAAAAPFAGTRFDVAAFPDDQESLAYLEQIEFALNTAGWIQIDWKGERVGPERHGKPAIGLVTLVGVRIDVHASLAGDTAEEKRALEAVTRVASAIDPNGIEAVAAFGTASRSANTQAVHITVGRKPPR